MNYDLTILYQLTDSLTGIVGVGGASTESPSSGTSTTSLEGLKYQRDLSSCLGFHKSGGNVSAITSSSCKNGEEQSIYIPGRPQATFFSLGIPLMWTLLLELLNATLGISDKCSD